MENRLKRMRKLKNIKKQFQKDFWRIFFIEAILFTATSLIAVLNAYKLNILVTVKKIYLPAISFQDFIFSFLLITFFIIIFISFKKATKFKEPILKGLFIITVFWGGMTVLNTFMPVFGAILTIGILIAVWLKIPSVWLHNLLMVLGLAGAASFFGLGFESSIIALILVGFSFYDFISVYRTKHMVKIAKDVIKSKIVFGFIIPKNLDSFLKKIEKSHLVSENFLVIGGGDVIFPNLLAVSVVPYGIIKSFIIILFSILGFLFSNWIYSIQKGKEPVPALPPIALFSIIGYLLTLFF